MSTSLKRRDANRQRLLREIVKRRKPELVPIVDSIDGHGLDEIARQELREVLVHELTAVGLGESDEPTAYGLVVEDLIDWVGRV